MWYNKVDERRNVSIVKWIIADWNHFPVILCGVFYSVLCIFSIVTGIIYMSGKKELNPLELSEEFVKMLNDSNKMGAFAKKMGFVTFVVGIVQGITALALFKGYHFILYYISMGFTIFSICSVLVKLKSKINMFPLIKLFFYVIILVILLLNSTRVLFF